MINKKLISIITFLFLLGCGYQPIFLSNESIFSINNIELDKKNEINLKIKNALKIYKKNNNTKKLYDLRINSKRSKVILSKDSNGDPKMFLLDVSVEINVVENNLSRNKKKFSRKINYKNKSNKFELKQYENRIISNLIDKILEEIIIYLQSV